jgi:UDP-glucuronate 4-epimerase
VSLLTIVEMLEQSLGRPIPRRHAPARPGDVPHTLADIGKAKRLLGYQPLVSFDEGFRRTVAYFKGG